MLRYIEKIFVILFACICLSNLLLSQEFDYKFKRLTTEDGLPGSIVEGVEKDSDGFIWISFEGGLSRYDGNSFKTFQHNPNDLNSLPLIYPGDFHKSHDKSFFFFLRETAFIFNPETFEFNIPEIDIHDISAYYYCDDSTIWIASKSRGLFKLDSKFNQLKHFNIYENHPKKINSFINEIFQDFSSDIWFSMRNEGIARIESNGNNIIYFKHQREEAGVIIGESEIFGSKANCFFQIRKNELWMGTTTGLVKLDTERELFTHYAFQEFDINDPNATSVDHLFHHNGILWLGTSKNGIVLFDIESEHFIKNYMHNPLESNSIVGNEIRDFYYSRQHEDGVLWISTLNGISYVDLYQKPFELYSNRSDSGYYIQSKNIRSIYADKEYLMFGGSAGLDLIDRNKKKHCTYSFNKNQGNSIGAGIVGSITKTDSNQFNITTWSGSFNQFYPTSGTFESWQAYHNDIGLIGWTFSDGYLDKHGTYWLLDLKEFLFKRPHNKKSFQSIVPEVSFTLDDMKAKEIYYNESFYEDILWFPSDNGLLAYHTITGELKRYLSGEGTKDKICNVIFNVLIDKNGIFWLGTGGCGLLKYSIENDSVRYFGKEEGLPSNYVYAILEDEQRILWMSTSNGLSRFNPVDESVQNYYSSDGIQGNEFNWGAKFKDCDGKLYFGGTQGVTAFFPSMIRNNPFAPDVNFTELYVKNHLVQVNEKLDEQIILTKPVNSIKTLELNYRNNDFALSFMSTHYANPIKSRFKYRLSGYEEKWNLTTPPDNKANYANLPPETYTLEVLASNMDGLWGNSVRELKIVIKPPWWQTLWFRSFFVLTFIGILFMYLKIRSIRFLKQQQKLELLVVEKTTELTRTNEVLSLKNKEIIAMAEKLHDIDQSKINFLTSVSHEFRTPLTLILGPVNNLLSSFPDSVEKVKNQLGIVQRNGQRLLRLINQLLDTSEIDAGTMKLKVSEDNIIDFIRSITRAFEFRAQNSNFSYQINLPTSGFRGYFDGDKLEKILYNLISNAMKYTLENGRVIVLVQIIKELDISRHGFYAGESRSENYLFAEVIDNGIGIPKDFLNKVFDRFYQVYHPEVRTTGTGIGLSLTRELIIKHKGQIQVKSHPGKGSNFRFILPVDRSAYKDEEIVSEQVNIDERIYAITSMDNSKIETSIVSGTNKDQLMLIVEDNVDMRNFISSSFADTFKILEAENGKNGVELALKEIPDIIISDVMMPVMSGIELCKQIRTNEKTSHIPLILLTAKSGEENQIEGLKTGANDYITKPFNVDALKLKTMNILHQRKKLQEKIADFLLDNHQDPHLTSMDESFIKKVNDNIDKSLDDPELNAEILAERIGYSRPHLFRKLKALTGKNITEYIRIYRLNRAAALLKTKNSTIAEVAYKVGYNNPSYFSKTFKELFGKSPQDFI